MCLFFSTTLSLEARCVKGNCRNGEGIMVFKKGDNYKGQFKNGQLHGVGRLRLHNGDVYIGNFSNGLFHGKGRYKFNNGDNYFGYWQKGHMHGKGTYTTSSGRKKIGTYQNGKLVSGTREQTSTTKVTQKPTDSRPTSDRLEHVTKDCTGVYCHEVMGIYKYGDGSQFVGYFKNGSPDGKGRCTYANGDVYEGEWKHHAPHGKGILHFANGQKHAAVWEYGTPKEQLLSDIDYISDLKGSGKEYNERVDIYALVVGVARYDHLPSLKYTDDDAYQVYAFLKSPEGGAVPEENVKVLVDDDATRTNILTTMDHLFSKADENDMVFLYISGHGLEGSFLPSDFNGYSNNLTYKSVTDIIDKSRAKSKICIADACHSGSLLASKTGYSASLDKYYDILKASRGGTALMMSSAAKEVSLEYSGLRQGVFSHYLLRGMKGEADMDRDKIVTITELYQFVSDGVKQYTAREQTPLLTGSYTQDMPVAMIR